MKPAKRSNPKKTSGASTKTKEQIIEDLKYWRAKYFLSEWHEELLDETIEYLESLKKENRRAKTEMITTHAETIAELVKAGETMLNGYGDPDNHPSERRWEDESRTGY